MALPHNHSTDPAESSLANPDQGTISGLREQIKSNASLLFPHGALGSPQQMYDIVIMTNNGGVTNPEKYAHESLSNLSDVTTTPLEFKAVLTYVPARAMSMRATSVVATGPPRATFVAALEGLLGVLAAALERYQGNVVKKGPAAPVDFAGGFIDEAATLGSGKGWGGSIFGGDKK